MMHRAYSVLEIKDFSEEERVIRGVATTPSVDRVGDVIEPHGIQFKNPMPLLWQHHSDAPVGLVNFEPASSRGIKFEARLPKVSEPGLLKDRVDEAWQSVKYRLVGGASIGFRPLKDGFEFMDEGGIRFKSIEVMELSLVTVPANQDCTIDMIRSLDRKSLAASGKKGSAVLLQPSPGASGSSPKHHSRRGQEMSKTLAEQISALEATRAAKAARMEEVMRTPIDEGRSTDEAEAEEFDTLQLEVLALDKDLARLRSVEKIQAVTARPVNGNSAAEGAASRAPLTPHITVKAPEKLAPGIEFARYVMCLAAGKGNLMQSAEIARQQYGEQSDVTAVLKAASRIGSTTDPNYFIRAAVQGGTTGDQEWAAPLVFAYPRFAGDFVEYLRPRTIIGQFGAGNIPSMRRIPFNVNIAGQSTGGTGYWVGEGAPKPLTQWQYTQTNLRWAKAATIAVLTDELVRFSSPAAETLVREELAASLIERLDIDFINPAKATVTNVSPASITNGVAPKLSQGSYGDAIRADVALLLGGYITANITPSSAVFIMSATSALALSIKRNALGQKEFPDMTMMGGMLEGIPVIASQYIGQLASTGGEIVILVNASDIWLADDGQVTVDASREASLQMDTAPTEEASGGLGASMVSMFQTNSVAVRAERYINWQKRRPAAVQLLGNVFWSSTARSGT